MYEITICMCNSLHTAYIQCCTMLVVQHDVLSSLHTMLYYASVQESAALYMQDSYRYVLALAGGQLYCGISSKTCTYAYVSCYTW